MDKTGGPVCSRCDDPAKRTQGHQALCAKHYRFGQMRVGAKRHGKAVPSHADLHAMRGADLVCPDCSVLMNWLAGDGQSNVASLQHYRDGTFAIVCLTCNTRHAHMDGDTFRDLPVGHKQCPQCREAKPFDQFCADNGRSGPMKLKSWCKACSSVAHGAWQIANRDHYNQKQREGRANRKERAQ